MGRNYIDGEIKADEFIVPAGCGFRKYLAVGVPINRGLYQMLNYKCKC